MPAQLDAFVDEPRNKSENSAPSGQQCPTDLGTLQRQNSKVEIRKLRDRQPGIAVLARHGFSS